MINVKINKDIRDYKTKLIFNLTGRQLLFTVLGLLTGFIINSYCEQYIGSELASWLTIIVTIPLFAIGWINIQGMPAELFFKQFLMNEFIHPKKRLYQSDNVFNYIEEQKKDKIIRKINKIFKKELNKKI